MIAVPHGIENGWECTLLNLIIKKKIWGGPEDRIQVFNKPKFVKDLIKKKKKVRDIKSAGPVQEQLTTEIQEEDGQQSGIRIIVYNGSLIEEETINSHTY